MYGAWAGYDSFRDLSSSSAFLLPAFAQSLHLFFPAFPFSELKKTAGRPRPVAGRSSEAACCLIGQLSKSRDVSM